MLEYFDNSIVTANIGNHAIKFEESKTQRNYAIAGCIVLTGIIAFTYYLKYKEQQKTIGFSYPISLPETNN